MREDWAVQRREQNDERSDDLVTQLLPILSRSLEHDFNIFDVMHHGTHEKQLSNVFGWLLDVGGTHGLGDIFLRIFIDEANTASNGGPPFPTEPYRVRQEVNTGSRHDDFDIADLVLTSQTATLVVENYFTSDGHGHGYERYLEYSRREGRHGGVVMLCRDEDRARLSEGWEQAIVLTYRQLVDRLHSHIDGDLVYRRDHPDASSFIAQMHRKFVSEGGRVSDRDVLGFVTAMCESGEAERYGWKRQEEVAEAFASGLAAQGRQRYVEGRELLHRIKGTLRSFSDGPLREQLDESSGYERVRRVSTTYAGIYQWTVNVEIAETDDETGAPQIQLKFGPTAWFANEQDPEWRHTVDPIVADYSRVFVTRPGAKEIRQTSVRLQEVLDGLGSTDTRLHDVIMMMLESE